MHSSSEGTLTHPAVSFRWGEQIHHLEDGYKLLKKCWKAFAPTDMLAWEQRISNAGGYIVAAYLGGAIAGILEGIRLDLGGKPSNVPPTFKELTANGTWKNHQPDGDTVVLVDLTVAPECRGAGLFEAFVEFARKTFESPSGVIFTYSPLFLPENRYWVVNKHERQGAKLTKELPRSRPDLMMTVGGVDLLAEDVGLTAYTL